MSDNPRIILQGVQDKSVPKRVAVPETNPIHLPKIEIMAATGPRLAFVANDTDLNQLYGAETFSSRGKYYNHQTQLLELMLAEGNTCLVQRITAPTITPQEGGPVISNQPKKASLTVLCYIDTTEPLRPYIRNIDGSIARNDLGAARRLTSASVTNGKTLKFYVVPTTMFDVALLDDGPVNYDGKSCYPLLTATHSFEGIYGENTGLRFWSANKTSPTPADPDIVAHQGATLYAAQIVTRKNAMSSPTISTSLLGETYIEFGLNEGVYNYKTDQDLKIQSLVENWNDDGAITKVMPHWGPLGEVVTYQANLDTVLDMLHANEQNAMDYCRSLATVLDGTGAVVDGVETPVIPTVDPTALAPSSKYLLDILSGVDYNGVPFYGFTVDTTAATFTPSVTHYLKDGNDGDLSVEAYETEIINRIENFYNDPEYPLVSTAKYPWSAQYDTGFGNDVKDAMLSWITHRKNVHGTWATYVNGEAPLSISAEESAGNALRAKAMTHAESSVFGTPAFRGVIIMQSGFLVGCKLKSRVPTGVYELAVKRARSLGAANGIVKEGSSYNQAPGNVLEFSRNVSCDYMTPTAEARVWAGGLNAATGFDRSALFFPSIQTIYGIQESVLIGEFFMQVICDIETQIEKTWRRMVNSDVPPAQFIQDSNATFNEFVNGKYDNRVIVTPNTYFTPLDTAKGYTWHMEVTVAGSVPKTVETASIVATRILEV